jgi:hypothetical protein
MYKRTMTNALGADRFVTTLSARQATFLVAPT